MNNNITVKTNFTSGQLSPHLYGRGDLGVYINGAKTLENVNIFPTGGVSRRKGLKMITPVAKASRLLAFEFNTEQVYLLCFEPNSLKIFKEQELVSTLETPWNEEQLKKINWTQSADTLLVVHPDVEPQQISRNLAEVWLISPWEYYSKDGLTHCPYYNFHQKKIGITPGGTVGSVILYAHQDIFDERFIGSRIRINKGEGIVTSYINPNQIVVQVTKAFENVAPSYNWEEASFSKRRGYPTSVTFHQDRMVIGGSKSLPNHLWLSKSSDLFNFDIGTGLDDEAIDFAILSDQVNAIINIVSTRHLLVFTTGAEWMVSGEPLTPSSIRLNRQTNVGSYSNFSLPPQNVDGATLFLSQSGNQLREFLYTDVEQAYQARDLTLLSTDIIQRPRDIVYHQDESILYIVLEDGSISCLTTYRSEEVNAWSKLRTKGNFTSIAVIGDELYSLVERENKTYLEIMDKKYEVDCGIELHSDVPTNLWRGLDYLEGQEVAVIADGFTVGKFFVSEGSITIYDDANDIIVGLPFEHVIEPLPYMVNGQQPYPPKAMRVIQGIFRLLDSQTFRINIGHGYFDVPLKKMYRDKILDAPISSYSGDVELRALGWVRDMKKPMWSIKNDAPCSFTLLSAVAEVKTKQ